MLLELTPKEIIKFYHTEVGKQCEQLTLKNKSSSCVAYKVKTTSPESFTVAPVSGILLPHQEIKVSLTLDPTEGTFTKTHKFMVQATSGDDLSSINWDQAEIHKLTTLMLDPVANAPTYQEFVAGKLQGELTRQQIANSSLEVLQAEADNLREQKANAIARNNEIKDNITAVTQQLRYSIKFDIQLKEIDNGFSYVHLVFVFFIGAMIGFLFLD